jgi:hypothetical protein
MNEDTFVINQFAKMQKRLEKTCQKSKWSEKRLEYFARIESTKWSLYLKKDSVVCSVFQFFQEFIVWFARQIN